MLPLWFLVVAPVVLVPESSSLAGRPSNEKAADRSVIRPFVKGHVWFWKIDS